GYSLSVAVSPVSPGSSRLSSSDSCGATSPRATTVLPPTEIVPPVASVASTAACRMTGSSASELCVAASVVPTRLTASRTVLGGGAASRRASRRAKNGNEASTATMPASQGQRPKSAIDGFERKPVSCTAGAEPALRSTSSLKVPLRSCGNVLPFAGGETRTTRPSTLYARCVAG